MKGIQSVVLACMLGLPFVVGAQLAQPVARTAAAPLGTPVKGPKKKGTDPTSSTSPTPPGMTTSTSPSATSVSTSTSSSPPSVSSISPISSASTRFSTTTNIIEISSFMTYPSSISSSRVASTSATVAAGYSGIDASMNPTSSAMSLNHTSNEHRMLIIVLSTVLGFVGILLIAASIFLACRCRQGRSPFGHRGASPINDDEIESWRGTAIEQKKQSPPDPAMLNRRVDSIQLTHSPGWTWTASPTSIRSVLSPSTTISDTPSFLAKAPNSRAGLTDETVPGADPFIPPMKRQSSRLSKAPPGHGRSKSRRSSMSAKSVWSYNGGIGLNTANGKMPEWFDPEDLAVRKELSRTEWTSSSPGTSIYDGLPSGGLAPRPRSQPRPWETDKEIGRAIA